MTDDLVTQLLPALARSDNKGFNVFDVMHHGLHEKQISNVFAWLLDTEGNHNLGERFQRIFIEEVNEGLGSSQRMPGGPYLVRQEVNTSEVDGKRDIADLVLESDTAGLVIENYFVSDGHEHSYDGYLNLAKRGRTHGAVVLLCRDKDSSLQTGGWEKASVVTYARLIERLHIEVERDTGYRRTHPEASAFITQMHRKFVKGRGPMQDQEVLDFVTAMCVTGEAGRYQEQPQNAAAERFARSVAEEAAERFIAGRDILQRIKTRLRSFCTEIVMPELNATVEGITVSEVQARYRGIYEWTVNFELADQEKLPEAGLQLKFGPSA